jgi:hypothetical protein
MNTQTARDGDPGKPYFRAMKWTATVACSVACFFAATSASAQDYNALMRQSQAEMNRIMAQGQQQLDSMVAQRMRDPAVQATYRQHVAQMQASGRPALDFPTYTSQYIATRGFTADGIRSAQAANADMQAKERAAWQGLQQAQAQRGQAQQAQRDGYYKQQQEAGRQLMGNSTYAVAAEAGVGATVQLPHTWAANSTHQHQGKNYHVDASGNYHVQAANGWWYPVQRR